MHHPTKCLLVLLVSVTLSGCLIGGRGLSAPASEGVAAMGEGLVGQANQVELSADARAKALEAEYQALQFGPAGQTVSWEADRYQGAVVPTQLYRIGSQDCRGYSHTLSYRGRSVKEVGTACRGEDGFWKPVV